MNDACRAVKALAGGAAPGVRQRLIDGGAAAALRAVTAAAAAANAAEALKVLGAAN